MDAGVVLESSPHSYVLVFADCVPVAGYRVGALYDLSRGSITTFPMAYFPLFERLRSETIGEIFGSFDTEDHGGLREFLGYLVEREHATVVDDPSRFPAMPPDWDAPAKIVDAVIDVDRDEHDFPRIIAELDRLGCLHLQVRAYSSRFGLEELADLARSCEGTSIQTIQALVLDDPDRRHEDYVALLTGVRIVIALVVHSATENRRVRVDFGARGDSAEFVAMDIEFTTTPVTSAFDCGTITRPSLLSPSTPTFMELRRWNGCLNRKLSIDARGQVRNCPAMPEGFGDHRRVSLSEVAADPQFRRAWHLRKDDIEVCRDCQFRHACTDCRALLSDPTARDSKPLKCGYDPYSDTWADWRTLPGADAAMAEYRRRRHLPIVDR